MGRNYCRLNKGSRQQLNMKCMQNYYSDLNRKSNNITKMFKRLANKIGRRLNKQVIRDEMNEVE